MICSIIFQGAAVGLVLGGILLSTNVDLGMETNLKLSDPRWIGNWWFGSVIVIIMSLILLPWIFGFPRVLLETRFDEELREDDKTPTDLVTLA